MAKQLTQKLFKSLPPEVAGRKWRWIAAGADGIAIAFSCAPNREVNSTGVWWTVDHGAQFCVGKGFEPTVGAPLRRSDSLWRRFLDFMSQPLEFTTVVIPVDELLVKPPTPEVRRPLVPPKASRVRVVTRIIDDAADARRWRFVRDAAADETLATWHLAWMERQPLRPPVVPPTAWITSRVNRAMKAATEAGVWVDKS